MTSGRARPQEIIDEVNRPRKVRGINLRGDAKKIAGRVKDGEVLVMIYTPKATNLDEVAHASTDKEMVILAQKALDFKKDKETYEQIRLFAAKKSFFFK